MPTYTFRNKETGETYDEIMSMSRRETYLEENPQIEQIIGSPAIGDPVRLGVRTIDDGFREVLSKIHNNNYRSNLAGKLSRR
jgi:hypothetical protein